MHEIQVLRRQIEEEPGLNAAENGLKAQHVHCQWGGANWRVEIVARRVHHHSLLSGGQPCKWVALSVLIHTGVLFLLLFPLTLCASKHTKLVEAIEYTRRDQNWQGNPLEPHGGDKRKKISLSFISLHVYIPGWATQILWTTHFPQTSCILWLLMLCRLSAEWVYQLPAWRWHGWQRVCHFSSLSLHTGRLVVCRISAERLQYFFFL